MKLLTKIAAMTVVTALVIPAAFAQAPAKSKAPVAPTVAHKTVAKKATPKVKKSVVKKAVVKKPTSKKTVAKKP